MRLLYNLAAILAVVMAVVYWKVPVPLKDRSAD